MDYKKFYDMVQYSWIEECLNIFTRSLFTRSERGLKSRIQTVRVVSTDIGRQFGIINARCWLCATERNDDRWNKNAGEIKNLERDKS